MLIYKQRYKPRTTREFTKSDLTVYDSAGNTALNALTVYGKSEVVDGSIKSAGEGWATVDLGTLTWSLYLPDRNTFIASVSGIKYPETLDERITGLLCENYSISTESSINWMNDKSILRYAGGIYIRDTSYTDAATFKNSLNGVILAYQLADPTQGNTIAIKTDNGTGIDGTMATFSTGTPLRGIPDTTVQDVMTWYGSAGTLMKKCGVDDLGLRTWNTSGSADHAFYIGIESRDTLSNTVITNLADYTQVFHAIMVRCTK